MGTGGLGGGPRLLGALAVVCMVAAACSGEPSAKPDRASEAAGAPVAAEAEEPAADAAPAMEPSGEASAPATPAHRRRSAPPRTPTTSASGPSAPATNGDPSPAAPDAPAPSSRPKVPRFAEETTGISASSIRLCTHVNGQAAAAFGGTFEDTRVFWRWVNDQGGIHGRQVDMVIADDADGATVAAAYEECRGSFLIIGGPSQEAVPSFREVVEADPNPAPYLHFMARSDPTKQYSFSWYPTQERLGVLTARFVLRTHPAKRIGVIRRDTDNWTPGFRAFVAELERHGAEPVVAVAHPPKEQFFEPYLAELAAKKAEVIWAWNHGAEHIPMLKQASARDYPFAWVLGFPLALASETLRDDVLDPVATGLNVFPTFRPGLYDEHHRRYEEQGRLFEAAYQKYRGRPADPVFADLLLRQWLDGLQVVELLKACGRDCTRTKAVTTLVHDLAHRPPSCPFDFSLGRAAGAHVSAVEAYRPSATVVAWRETAHCVASF